MSDYKLPYVNYGGSSGVSPSGITNWGGASDQSNPFGTSNIAASANPLAAAVGGAADALTVGGTTGATGGTTAAPGATPTPNNASGTAWGIDALSVAGTPLPGSMQAAQAAINKGESTPDFWSNLEQSNPTMFASIMETAQRGAGIPTGGISTTGADISGSSPQRFLSADFGEGAFFGTDNTPSAMIAPALSAYESTYGHNPWDIDPSTGQQYAFPGQTSVATQQETAHKSAATQAGQNRDATAQSVATQKESAATQAQQNRDATALASSNTTAYNQLAGLGLGGLFTSQDPNYDYTNLISGITGANALSSSDKSTLQDILSNYTQGSAYKNNPELQEKFASVIADPEKRTNFLKAVQLYQANPQLAPGDETSFPDGVTTEEVSQTRGSDLLKSVLGMTDFGLPELEANIPIWNNASNIASNAPWTGWEPYKPNNITQDMTWGAGPATNVIYSLLGGTGTAADESYYNFMQGDSGSSPWDADSTYWSDRIPKTP